jgi:hypothetical protein
MDNYENAIAYIETQEATNISYVKIGDNNKNLIVSFGSNGHDGFERKTSLMKLRFEKNNFDVLYLRNRHQWYIGGLKGIGKNIDHTLAFLKKQFALYNKVLCIGSSAGGYASLLFGSLLKVNKVITLDAQTDLQYCIDNLPGDGIGKKNLIARSKECPVTWKKYNRIVNILNENVVYDAISKGDGKCLDKGDLALHGDYHYDQIKSFPSVTKLTKGQAGISVILKFLQETS